MKRTEDKMTGERGMDTHFCRFPITDLTYDNQVRVLSEDASQASGKSEANLGVHGNLADAVNLIFDGIFHGNKATTGFIEGLQNGIKR